MRTAGDGDETVSAEPDDLDEDGQWFPGDGPDGPLGCWNCDEGWRHGCCDDLCRGSNEAEDCDSPMPCRLCNPDGEPSW